MSMPERLEPIYAAFAANVKSLDTLRQSDGVSYCPGAVKIEKHLILSPADFAKLAEDISLDYPLLKDNRHLMSADPGGCFHCLLVTAENMPEGLLVAKGHRELYLAYAKDYQKLEVAPNIPVQRLPLEEPKVYQEKAAFFRKAIQAETLKTKAARTDSFCVEKVVVLSDEAYQSFKDGGLMQDEIFLFDNIDRMYYDPGAACWHCLLIKGETSKDGILAEAEGYACARYAAFAPDCRKLRLQDVPVHYEYPAKASRQKAASKKRGPER